MALQMQFYFEGTEAEWSEVNLGEGNEVWSGLVLFYSEEQPLEKFGNYWCYVDGVPTVWVDPAVQK